LSLHAARYDPRMKLIVVTSGLNLRSGGGSNHSLHLMLSELCRRSIDLELVVLSAGGLKAPDRLPYRMRLLEWPTMNRLQMMLLVHRLLRACAHATDLYHLYGPQLVYGGGRYRLSGGSVPVVVTLNDYQPVCTNINEMDGACHTSCTVLQRSWHARRSLTKRILRLPLEGFWSSRGRTYAQAIDRLLPDSDSLRTVYAEAGFDMRRSTVISEIVDYERLRVLGKQRRGSGGRNGREWRIAYVGRLVRAKGVDLLLDAVKELGAHARLRLDIAGDGPERATLEHLCQQLGLSDRVTFHGWLREERLWSIYRRADLFVHPGRWPEPFGRTILEAMTFGVPTIASNVGHPPTLIRDAGLTFTTGDSADLSRTIATAIDDYDRLESLARGAVDRVAQYGPETVVDALVDLYRALLGDGRTSRSGSGGPTNSAIQDDADSGT
jgi:glycosyltransferase involved in cell wall biosynthesis